MLTACVCLPGWASATRHARTRPAIARLRSRLASSCPQRCPPASAPTSCCACTGRSSAGVKTRPARFVLSARTVPAPATRRPCTDASPPVQAPERRRCRAARSGPVLDGRLDVHHPAVAESHDRARIKRTFPPLWTGHTSPRLSAIATPNRALCAFWQAGSGRDCCAHPPPATRRPERSGAGISGIPSSPATTCSTSTTRPRSASLTPLHIVSHSASVPARPASAVSRVAPARPTRAFSGPVTVLPGG